MKPEPTKDQFWRVWDYLVGLMFTSCSAAALTAICLKLWHGDFSRSQLGFVFISVVLIAWLIVHGFIDQLEAKIFSPQEDPSSDADTETPRLLPLEEKFKPRHQKTGGTSEK